VVAYRGAGVIGLVRSDFDGFLLDPSRHARIHSLAAFFAHGAFVI
jgi:hypothetical protein